MDESKDRPSALRRLPSTDAVLRAPGAEALAERWGRAALVRAVRSVADDLRRQAASGGEGADSSPESVLAAAGAFLERAGRPSLSRVINATGTIVHTGLGRSLLAEAAIEALEQAARYPCALEVDMQSGRRGSRDVHVRDLLCELTGAAAAAVVNNNAAAVSLAVNTIAQGREVIVSRGQLVEIGGSFRLPDVIERSGARLVEVGTTNRTRLPDFAGAITDSTALLLWVHASNYRILGFAEQVELPDLVALGRQRGIPVMADLGSGALVDVSALGLGHEPTAQEAVRAGANVITFSGDKLLGGPQAGVILGDPDAVGRMKRNPLARAVRVGKLTLAALEATLRLYRDPDSLLEAIPTLRMISRSEAEVEGAARQVKQAAAGAIEKLARASVERGASCVGGGALPGDEIPTWVVALEPVAASAEDLAARLRGCTPPVLGRIHRGRVLLDMRTVHEDQVAELVAALAAVTPHEDS
jgi:L-seryl-tRNA(Ser) seleniumtransferase